MGEKPEIRDRSLIPQGLDLMALKGLQRATPLKHLHLSAPDQPTVLSRAGAGLPIPGEAVRGAPKASAACRTRPEVSCSRGWRCHQGQ